MRLVRIAIANANATVGAVTSNTDRALNLVHQASRDDATIVVLPEQVIGGYPPEDLVQWRGFVDSQSRELLRFAREAKATKAAIAIGVTVARGAHIYNAAALVHGGEVLGLVPKEKLPFYNVFYEARTLARGAPGLYDEVNGVPFGDIIFDFDFGSIALEICEDIWSPEGPMRRRCQAGAEVVLNLSASPFRLGMNATRLERIATRSADNEATVAYANLVGGNDGLIFDGGGFIVQNGRPLLEAPRFREGVSAVTVDLDRTKRLRVENTTWRLDQESSSTASQVRRIRVNTLGAERALLSFPSPPGRSFFLPVSAPPVDPRTAFCEELLDALALGVGDYFEKTRVFKTIGVALSGGRDSLLCLIIARRYIDRAYGHLGVDAERAKASEILRAFFMPSRFSSDETRRAAESAAKELDVPLTIVSIDDAVAREAKAMEAMLQPGESLTPIALQNIQARIRAARMWTWANAASGLFLQTSNMSEKAAGYTTIGGDMEGALSVIANVPKTVVNFLLDYILEKTAAEGIRLTLIKPASAELADDMEDEKDLMPFLVLDACFALYAGEKMSPGEVSLAIRSIFPDEDAAKLDAWTDKFAKLFTASIYKWVQAPLSLHVGNLDLDRERALQLPVVQNREWT